MMMRENEIRQLIESSDDVNFAPYGEGVSDERILAAEKDVGIKFPPSYVWWLKSFGGGEIRGGEVYSVYDVDDFQGGGDIAYMWKINKRNRTADDNQLFIFQARDDESYYFKLDEEHDGEFPIYTYDYVHGVHRKYASDFLEFLKKKITS